MGNYEKMCSMCHKCKNISEFPTYKRNGIKKYRVYCKECNRIYHREYMRAYREMHAEYREYCREYSREYVKRKKANK